MLFYRLTFPTNSFSGPTTPNRFYAGFFITVDAVSCSAFACARFWGSETIHMGGTYPVDPHMPYSLCTFMKQTGSSCQQPVADLSPCPYCGHVLISLGSLWYCLMYRVNTLPTKQSTTIRVQLGLSEKKYVVSSAVFYTCSDRPQSVLD